MDYELLARIVAYYFGLLAWPEDATELFSCAELDAYMPEKLSEPSHVNPFGSIEEYPKSSKDH